MTDSGLSGSCVYLLVERDYLRAGVPLVVKVGRSTRVEARVREYPKHSRLICATRVCDAVAAEAALLRMFTSDFARRADLGNEYFQVAGASAQTKGAGIVLAHHVFSKAVSEFVSLGPEYTDGDTASEGDETPRDQSEPSSDADNVIAAEVSPSTPPQSATATTVAPAPSIDAILSEFMQGLRVTRGGDWCSGDELYSLLNEWLVRRNDTDVRVTCARMLTGINALYRPVWQRRNDMMMMRVPRQPQDAEDAEAREHDNNVVQAFVQAYLRPEAGSYFTLKQAKDMFVTKDDLRQQHIALSVLKTTLNTQLGVACIPEKTIGGRKEKSVFMGYRLIQPSGEMPDTPDVTRTADPRLPAIMKGLQSMLCFDPPRPEELKDKQYYAWLKERDIVDQYWSVHGRDLKREGCPKPELRKLVRMAMEALGHMMHSRLRTHRGDVQTAYDRVAFMPTQLIGEPQESG